MHASMQDGLQQTPSSTEEYRITLRKRNAACFLHSAEYGRVVSLDLLHRKQAMQPPTIYVLFQTCFEPCSFFVLSINHEPLFCY
jgi:hypothetical protein